MVAVACAPALVLLAGGHLRRLAGTRCGCGSPLCGVFFTRVVVRSVACHALGSLPSLRARRGLGQVGHLVTQRRPRADHRRRKFP
jgi:hypothetical protein